MKKAFSLVELMISVSILAIGITAIARSFLTAVGALDSVQNRLRAIQFLQAKMNETGEEAKINGGLECDVSEGETELNNRSAKWKLEAVSVEDEDLKEYLNEVKLSLSWQEANKAQDEALVTYFPNKNKK